MVATLQGSAYRCSPIRLLLCFYQPRPTVAITRDTENSILRTGKFVLSVKLCTVVSIVWRALPQDFSRKSCSPKCQHRIVSLPVGTLLTLYEHVVAL